MAVPTEMSTLLEWQPQLPSSRNSTTSIPPEETPMKMVEERKADRCANVEREVFDSSGKHPYSYDGEMEVSSGLPSHTRRKSSQADESEKKKRIGTWDFYLPRTVVFRRQYEFPDPRINQSTGKQAEDSQRAADD
ncbi:hypothetical protein Bca52824_081184 [Brassica carinata]|uniref:Uncharacterized protein n=1 Tax=Brassica carinata TaxID=52824 RepID=A0A8X7PI81_BRACI|nr:hypothetical protein Bca52824_081184 [Brassica carinata]